MNRPYRLSLLILLAGALLLSGAALAQDNEDLERELEEDLEDEDFADSDNGDDNLAIDLLDVDDTCDVDGDLGSTLDISSDVSAERSERRESTLEEDDVLLAIALANNGIDNFDVEDVFTRSLVRTDTASFEQDTDLDREDVFSAVALGVGDDLSDDEITECASDISDTATIEVREESTLDLVENDVLLAIALSNSFDGGGDLDFEDVADLDRDESARIFTDRDVDLDREDALLLLAFG